MPETVGSPAHGLARLLHEQNGSCWFSGPADDFVALVEEAERQDPSVAVLPTSKVRGWPEDAGNEGTAKSFEVMPLSLALEATHQTDALLVQYSCHDVEHGAKRLRGTSLAEDTELTVMPQMVLFVLDVDCPKDIKLDGPAPDSWLAAERVKVDRLRAVHPGGFYYATRGGYRVLYRIAPVTIASEEDAEQWKATFLAHAAYVRDDFGIEIDEALSSWLQLVKLPRVPNAAMRRDTIDGDPMAIGLWTHTPSPDQVVAFRGAKARSKGGPRAAGGPVYAGNPDEHDPMVQRAQACGLIKGELSRGKFAVVCPQEHLHVSEGGLDKTVYFNGGGFKCFRDQCKAVTRWDFVRMVESREVAATSHNDLPATIEAAIAGLVRPGAAVIQVPTGAGKSFSLRKIIKQQRDHAFLVPTHRLAEEQVEKFAQEPDHKTVETTVREPGKAPVDVVKEIEVPNEKRLAHHAGVTQRTTGRGACLRLVEAEQVKAHGLSVRRVLCPSCPHKQTCDARKEPTGWAPIAPHSLASSFTASHVLVFDEQFALSEEVTITLRDLELAVEAVERYADKKFGTLCYEFVRSKAGIPVSKLLDGGVRESALRYANETFVGGQWTALETPRVHPADPDLARALADCADDVPGLSESVKAEDRAAALPALSALAKVRKWARKDCIAEVQVVEGQQAARVCVLSKQAIAFRDARKGAIVMSASPWTPALQALRPDLVVTRIAVEDPPGLVHRTLIRASDTNVAELRSDKDRLRRYVRTIEQRAEQAGCARTLVMVAKTLEADVRGWLDPGRFEVAHYGALAGLDQWKDFDGYATIGEVWGNIMTVGREARLLGIPESEHKRSIVEGELCQAHGRARDPRRTKPAHHWHIGGISPLGWNASNCLQEDFPMGRPPREQTVDKDALASLVGAYGSQLKAANAAGVSVRTVSSWLSGKSAAPADAIEKLRQGAGHALCGVLLHTNV